eukprot:446234_1
MGSPNQLVFPHQHINRSIIKNKSLKIATWNLNGLNDTAKCILNLNKHDILGIQEIHQKHFNQEYLDDIFDKSESEFILSKPPEDDDKYSGVAFIINKKIKKCIISKGTPSSRIVWMRLNTNYYKIFVINVYIPYEKHKTRNYNDTI